MFSPPLVFLYICVVSVVNAAAVLIIDTVMYGVVLILWFLIVGVVGSFINGLTGRRVSPPTPPSFSSFRTRTAASRGQSRFSLRTNQTHSRPNTNTTGTYNAYVIHLHIIYIYIIMQVLIFIWDFTIG